MFTFLTSGHCDIDRLTSESKLNKDYVLTNREILISKYELCKEIVFKEMSETNFYKKDS